MRLDDLGDEMADRQAVKMLVGLGRERGQFAENVAATLRLAAQEGHVLGIGAALRQFALQFLRHEGEMVASGVPSSVRASRGQPVERREMLLAREHQLGRGQGLGKLRDSSATRKA